MHGGGGRKRKRRGREMNTRTIEGGMLSHRRHRTAMVEATERKREEKRAVRMYLLSSEGKKKKSLPCTLAVETAALDLKYPAIKERGERGNHFYLNFRAKKKVTRPETYEKRKKKTKKKENRDF